MKRRRNLYLSLILHSEAFALPITVRTSNAEAHADMCIYINAPYAYFNISASGYIKHTHGHLPLLCFDSDFESCEVSECQDKTLSKRLSIFMSSLPIFQMELEISAWKLRQR